MRKPRPSAGGSPAPFHPLPPAANRYKQPFLVPFARSSVVLGKTMSRRLRNLRRDLQALRKQNYRVIVFMIERTRVFTVQHSGSELLQGIRVYLSGAADADALERQGACPNRSDRGMYTLRMNAAKQSRGWGCEVVGDSWIEPLTPAV